MDEQILNLASSYLARHIQIGDFQQRFVGLYFEVRRNRSANQIASRLCDAIIGPYAEFSRGDRSEESFREELAEAIRLFYRRENADEARVPF